ncbi:MAG: putative quinol monooxygenase [Alphaproteobacteria bacterium]
MSDVDDKKIYVNGYIDVPFDKRAEVLKELPTHVALTQNEEGCLWFQIIECKDVQNRLLVSEIFKDKAAFRVHQERAVDTKWARVTKCVERNLIIKEGSEIYSD